MRKTTIELTHLDLLNLLNAADRRIEECVESLTDPAVQGEGNIGRMIVSEALEMWKETRKHLQVGLDQITEDIEASRIEWGYSSKA